MRCKYARLTLQGQFQAVEGAKHVYPVVIIMLFVTRSPVCEASFWPQGAQTAVRAARKPRRNTAKRLSRSVIREYARLYRTILAT